eukprot:scaffold94132_cov48-Prasinocladus_malaysianus.AAC.2
MYARGQIVHRRKKHIALAGREKHDRAPVTATALTYRVVDHISVVATTRSTRAEQQYSYHTGLAFVPVRVARVSNPWLGRTADGRYRTL